MASIHKLEIKTVRSTKHVEPRSERRSLAPVVALKTWGTEEEEESVSTDALDMIARSAAAAFAVDPKDRIIYWNEGAEKLLGLTAREAMGRSCHEVLEGHDPFGNLYCSAQCPIMSLMKVGVTAEPFCMDVKKLETNHDPNRVKLRIRTVAFPESGANFTALVHLLDTDDEQRLEKLVTELRETAKGIPHSPASPAGRPRFHRRAHPPQPAHPARTRDRGSPLERLRGAQHRRSPEPLARDRQKPHPEHPAQDGGPQPGGGHRGVVPEPLDLS